MSQHWRARAFPVQRKQPSSNSGGQMAMGRLETAKHIGLGVLFFTISIVGVRTAMVFLYELSSRPFAGSIASVITFNLILGALSVALYQTLFVLTTNRRIARSATTYGAGFGCFVQGATLIHRMSEGIIPAEFLYAVPAIAMLAPWIIAAVIARHRLLIEWRHPPKTDRTASHD